MAAGGAAAEDRDVIAHGATGFDPNTAARAVADPEVVALSFP